MNWRQADIRDKPELNGIGRLVRSEPKESQSPVVDERLTPLDAALRDASVMAQPIMEVLQPPLPVADRGDAIEQVFASLASGNPAVMVTDGGRAVGVLTRADLLTYLASRSPATNG
jgi:cystathionine beta-synthase